MDLPAHLSRQFDEGNRLRKYSYRGRFAPSPSGVMHLGNLRTALLSWLRARLEEGIWLLRVDDLDSSRTRPGAVESFKSDLLWLGLDWDGPIIRQSRRRGLYSTVLSTLRRNGRVYPCRCSRRTLSRLSEESGKKKLYPGTCKDLRLSWGAQEGRLPSWRLDVNKKFKKSSGDIVVRRSDGFIGYHLATVIDELTLGITEVVRGEDLREGMSTQLAIFDVINRPSPVAYRHVPLLLDRKGSKLSKRNGNCGLEKLKQTGLTSPRVVGLLAESLNLVPKGAELSAHELLSDLRVRPETFYSVFDKGC
ncbi:tRNA glutamyl-Q(34) synthetase GluQRS [Prochlorococcus sp. MIT 1341]|uniref:tRNA glutamyl-Q(34) synthetase GluQRS n=1 Tax=Prochlorococcus sp. MIT 1341 TaxID=3096221 RepID=UPI002A751FF9|nr:tRNA glutamyl-Q(34) synthetase GluQRS [Prochlorococcus sp. MIT 1341]